MLKITHKVCQKKEEQREFFFFFLGPRILWGLGWLLALLKEATSQFHLQQLCTIKSRGQQCIFGCCWKVFLCNNRLFGAALNALVSVSVWKWSWNRRLFPVSSFHILLCPARVCDSWVMEIFFLFFFFLFYFWLYIANMYASVERLVLVFFPWGLFQV